MNQHATAGPTKFDVLCDKGKEAFNHKGNKVYRDFLSNNVEKYDTAAGKEKKKVAQRTVKAFRHVTGGRFLKCKEDGMRYDIGDKEAVQKTQQAFRDKKKLKKEGKPTDKSSTNNEDMVCSPHDMAGVPPSVMPKHPIEYDVLCDKTKEAFNHKGNIVYRQFISANAENYHAAPQLEKRKVAQRTVDAFRQAAGGNFLERKGDGNWYEIGDKEAVKRTQQAFRDKKKLKHEMMGQNKKLSVSNADGASATAGNTGASMTSSASFATTQKPGVSQLDGDTFPVVSSSSKSTGSTHPESLSSDSMLPPTPGQSREPLAAPQQQSQHQQNGSSDRINRKEKHKLLEDDIPDQREEDSSANALKANLPKVSQMPAATSIPTGHVPMEPQTAEFMKQQYLALRASQMPDFDAMSEEETIRFLTNMRSQVSNSNTTTSASGAKGDMDVAHETFDNTGNATNPSNTVLAPTSQSMATNPVQMNSPPIQSTTDDFLYATLTSTATFSQKGNTILKGLISQHKEIYGQFHEEKDRKKLATVIVTTYRKRFGCRFLSRHDDDNWHEISDSEALRMIQQTFRDRINLKRKIGQLDDDHPLLVSDDASCSSDNSEWILVNEHPVCLTKDYVICGSSLEAFDHEGNKLYREVHKIGNRKDGTNAMMSLRSLITTALYYCQTKMVIEKAVTAER